MSEWMRGCEVDYGSSTVTGGPFPDDTVAPISMLFGPRAPIEYAPGQFTGWTDPATGQRVDYHYGIDIAPPAGTPLVALGYGKVTQVIVGDSSFGNAVKCEYTADDGTYAAMYLHMTDRALATVGDTVTPGQVLGYVGTTGASSGPHLHMQVWRDDYTIDPMVVLVGANAVGHVPPAPAPPPGAAPVPMSSFNYLGKGPEWWMYDYELRLMTVQPAPNLTTVYMGRQGTDEVWRIRVEDWQ